MNEVRILILGGKICKIVSLNLWCVWVELFEVDRSRFRWLQGVPKPQTFGKS